MLKTLSMRLEEKENNLELLIANNKLPIIFAMQCVDLCLFFVSLNGSAHRKHRTFFLKHFLTVHQLRMIYFC